MSQHLQHVIPSVSFANAKIEEFIVQNINAREVRKGLAVKLVFQGYLYEEIQRILGVSLGSITGLKQVYEDNGIDDIWGKTDQEIMVPVVNEREKQTYYGAIDYLQGELILKTYNAGNSKNTIDYLRYLLDKSPNQQLLTSWMK